jgi:hypothetical protein
MADDTKSSMKSAYELALERLEREGIERPREGTLSEAERREIEEVKKRAGAKLAELEILHRDRLSRLADPGGREQEEEQYLAERRRIEADREAKVAALRGARSAG